MDEFQRNLKSSYIQQVSICLNVASVCSAECVMLTSAGGGVSRSDLRTSNSELRSAKKLQPPRLTYRPTLYKL